jgi:hypothetical protein
MIRVTEDEYYGWFRACGYERTGNGTETTEDLYNIDRKKIIQVPRPQALSPEHRREAAEGMGRYFGWGISQGVH